MGGAAVFGMQPPCCCWPRSAGKLMGVHAGRPRGCDGRRARPRVIGWLLQTQGADHDHLRQHPVGQAQVITSETFTALLLMAVASTMLTVPVVEPKLRRVSAAGMARPA